MNLKFKFFKFEIEIEELKISISKCKEWVTRVLTLFSSRINAILPQNKALVWGIVGAVFILIGFGSPYQLFPLVFPSLAIYCGYKSKLWGNIKLGNTVIWVGFILMIIRVALLLYGVTTDEDISISSSIPSDLTEEKKSRVLLFTFSYLIVLTLTFVGMIFTFVKFVWSIFKRKEIKTIKRWLIWVIITGIFIYILSLENVVEIVKSMGR